MNEGIIKLRTIVDVEIYSLFLVLSRIGRFLTTEAKGSTIFFNQELWYD